MHNPRNSVRATIVALFVFMGPSFSWAQEGGGGGGGGGGSSGGSHAAGLQFGQVWPAGDIGNGADGSIAPGLFYEYSASQLFALQVNLVRSSHNDRLTIFSTTAGIRANLTFFDRLVPYASAGVGMYFVDRMIGTTPAEELSTTNFGLNVHLGADLDLNPSFFMGLWLGLHNLFSASGTTQTGTAMENSGRWSALFIRAGMRF